MSLGEKVMASFFQSVTNRTAGYATISQSGLHTETKLVNSILMFIGGSPGGTAGGRKNNDLCYAVFRLYDLCQGR